MKKLTITVICTILFKLHIERHLKMLDTTSITKVNSKKLNKMEYEILLLLNFNLFIEESLFAKYKSGLLQCSHDENPDNTLQTKTTRV